MSHLTNCDRCGEHTWVDDIEEAPGVFCEDCQKWYAEHPGPAAMSRLEPLTADTAIRLLERAVVEVESLRQQLRGAVEALYSAHDFISRVLKWEGDDDTEQSELLAEIAKHLPVGGQ